MGKHVRYAVSELGNWKTDQLTMHFLVNIGIFHCYVGLPEGIYKRENNTPLPNEGSSWESCGSSPYSTPEGACASPSSERGIGNSKGQVLTASCGKMEPPPKNCINVLLADF